MEEKYKLKIKYMTEEKGDTNIKSITNLINLIAKYQNNHKKI